MSEYVYAGLTSQTIDIFLQDSSSSTGQGLSGLVFDSAGLVASYRKGATGSRTAITLATQTVGGAYSSGGFVEIESTHMKGVYRLDLPNAAVDTEGFVTLFVYGATNLLPTALRIDCRPLPVDVKKVDTQTASAAAGVTFPASIASPTNITAATGVTLAAVTHTGAVIPTVTNVTDGVTLATTQPAITFGAVTIDVSGSTPNITLTGSGSGNGIEWTRSGSGNPLDADVIDQIQSGLSTLDASGVRSAVGLASANLDTQLSDIPTLAEFEARSIVAANYATSSALSTVEGKIDTIDNFIDTEVLAIKAVTDKIDTGLVLDGAVYQFTANMLELGPSGGGGSSVNVLPATGIVADRSAGVTLTPVVGETISQSITMYRTDGTTAVNVSGKTLAIVFETLSGVDVATVASGNITISGASSNIVTFAYPAAVTASERTLRFAIRDAAAPSTLYLQGLCSVVRAPQVDA
jgi:hypothetical protein